MNHFPEKFNFPEFELFKKNLNDLANFNFEGLSAEDIYHKFYNIVEVLPLYDGILNPEKFNQIPFYRTRLNINSQNEDTSLVMTYSFPPANICKDNGRANLAGKSVFYCSNDPIAAIIECKPEIGNEGYLSVWEGIAKREVKSGIFLPNNLPRMNHWDILGQESYENWTKYISENHPNYSKHFVELYDFINKKFIDEKKPYPLTSFLSNEMLFNNSHKDFFIYPSVIANSKLSNIAFHPNSVIENLKFSKVIKFKVINIENNNIIFNLGKVGTLHETKMIWKNCTEEETKLFIETKT